VTSLQILNLPSLRTRKLGRPTLHVAEVDSTQEVLKRELDHGRTEGTVVLADRQAQGRGRQGHVWLSIPGEQLFASVLLRPALPPDRLPLLSIAAGVALCEAMESWGLSDLGLKWPNDVFIAARKVAGVLPELTHVKGSQTPAVILGIGINLHGTTSEIPSEIASIATTVQAHGTPPDRLRSLAEVLNHLEGWYDEVAGLESGRIQREFAKRWIWQGQMVVVRDTGTELRGKAQNIDESGALLVVDPAGRIHRVISGDISRLPPP
jgi:BirA family biotin operon repressor/biotin-[acetyl-CoA-carboxylase] ligase